jgi:hypothetical protein
VTESHPMAEAEIEPRFRSHQRRSRISTLTRIPLTFSSLLTFVR